jgi:hypothetical protein
MIISPCWKDTCTEYLSRLFTDDQYLRLPIDCISFEQADFDVIIGLAKKYRNQPLANDVTAYKEMWQTSSLPPLFSFVDLELEARTRLLYRKRSNLKFEIQEDLENSFSSYQEFAEVLNCVRACIEAIEKRCHAVAIIQDAKD